MAFQTDDDDKTKISTQDIQFNELKLLLSICVLCPMP